MQINIETIIFQWICIEILRRLKLDLCFAALISAVLFAVSHGWEGRWPIEIFVAGVVLAYVFMVEKYRENGRPIFLTFAVHAVFNFMVFVISIWG
ncbi:type II CAAX prenyl endopeptidase Rce1 family protein [Herbaspirillum frisingense]|uniref:CPBP family glutamic-type intramembrane protease n=1 Tax=Herbaspirillum frisingense TaxID=92645 RepID=UPI0039B0563A